MNNSEIARIREQIELESAAMKFALYGFATVAKHEFISHKYDPIGKCQEQLGALVGEEEATATPGQTYIHVLTNADQDGDPSSSLPPACQSPHVNALPTSDEPK